MPDFNFGGAHKYINLGGGWHWYAKRMSMASIRDEGWKLHVSANANTAQAILDLTLRDLRKGRIAHKVLGSTEALDNQRGGIQTGKFFCIYPDSIEQAFVIVSELDRCLNNVVGRHDVPCIIGDKWVGRTVVYARYGAYNARIWDPIRQLLVGDSIGKTKPDWVEDPWIHYPNISMLKHIAPWPTHPREGRRKRPIRRH